jgi:hypothetical protein
VKAFFWSAGDDGCAWYRMHLPSIALGARGHRTHATNLYDERWDDADVIVGQRIANPGPASRWHDWARAGRRLVFDVDDHYFAFDETNAAAYAFYGQPEVRDRIAANMAAADLITCATPRLAEEMAHYNPAVTVVPNGLPAAILDWPARQPSDRVTIGWAGSPSTAPELLLAAAAVDGILARPPARVRLGFHTIGVDPTIIGRAGLRNPFTPRHPLDPALDRLPAGRRLRHLDRPLPAHPVQRGEGRDEGH